MRVEQAHKVFESMSLKDCISIWNDSITTEYGKRTEVHSIDDNDWWVYLIEHIEGRYFAADMQNSEKFSNKDDYFFYDADGEQFKSFSTKDDMIYVCSEDFFIEALIRKEE